MNADEAGCSWSRTGPTGSCRSIPSLSSLQGDLRGVAPAALRYQHATAERRKEIASYLDEVIASTQVPSGEVVVKLTRGGRAIDQV